MYNRPAGELPLLLHAAASLFGIRTAACSSTIQDTSLLWGFVCMPFKLILLGHFPSLWHVQGSTPRVFKGGSLDADHLTHYCKLVLHVFTIYHSWKRFWKSLKGVCYVNRGDMRYMTMCVSRWIWHIPRYAQLLHPLDDVHLLWIVCTGTCLQSISLVEEVHDHHADCK